MWQGAILQFWNGTYELPKQSISILSDCKHVSFNTATVRSQYGERSARTVQSFANTDVWGAFFDGVPNILQASFKDNKLLEQMTTTKDKTDYLWYTLSHNHTSSDGPHLLHVYSKAHVIHAYVNGAFVGSAHGSHKQQDAVMLDKPISLTKGQNTISLLSVMVGSPNAGAFLERRFAGLRRVTIFNSRNQTVDLSEQQWGYQVGLTGEKSKIYTKTGSSSVDWKTNQSSLNQPLTWYKTVFDAPSGKHPVSLDLSSMGKGEAWINGNSIGRYWISFKTYKGRPSQYLYHVPRQFLKPSGNLLVLFEEMGGNPLYITVNTMSVNRLCSMASESDLPSPSSQLRCPEGRNISSIEFASYGSPSGNCKKYSIGSCHSFASKSAVEEACVGKRRCSIPLSASIFGGDPCPETSKSLLVVANCS